MIAYDVRVDVPSLNVRKNADIKTNVVKTVTVGEILQITEEKNGFGKLGDGSGWVMLEFVEKISTPKTRVKEEREVEEDGELDEIIEDEK